jgi:hypothetical protein
MNSKSAPSALSFDERTHNEALSSPETGSGDKKGSYNRSDVMGAAPHLDVILPSQVYCPGSTKNAIGEVGAG